MTIHHATVKRAEKAGIVLTELEARADGATMIRAFWPKRAVATEHASPKAALDVAILKQRLHGEYSNVRVDLGAKDDQAGTIAIDPEGEGEFQLIEFNPMNFDIDDVFTRTLEEMVEQGIDFVEADSEDEDRGNIVPRKYREKYAAQGHPNTCGDWLANVLNDRCLVLDEKGKPIFDIDAFDAIFDANKGDRSGKWNNAKVKQSNGWQGRYRMSGRIALAKTVAINKVIKLPGEKDQVPPADWVAAHTPKPKTKKAA